MSIQMTIFYGDRCGGIKGAIRLAQNGISPIIHCAHSTRKNSYRYHWPDKPSISLCAAFETYLGAHRDRAISYGGACQGLHRPSERAPFVPLSMKNFDFLCCESISMIGGIT